MKPAKLVVIGMVLFSAVITYFGMINSGPIQNEYQFPGKLSQLQLFKGTIQDLEPNNGIVILELSSTLFTDYAEKQRLLKLPQNTKIQLKNDGLPLFPEGTLLAKTFYYGKQILETRILFLKNGKWNAITYQWNPEQTEAFLITKGATVTVKRENLPDINYHIPSSTECTSCHRDNGLLQPIGPKIRNLNRMVLRDGKTISQLAYLQEKNLLAKNKTAIIHQLPDYNDTSKSLSQRARAYMDINCAHCHSPFGMAGSRTLNLSYETPYEKSGIAIQKPNILYRMETLGALHMPKLGTTITDEKGLALIKAYIKQLDQDKK